MKLLREFNDFNAKILKEDRTTSGKKILKMTGILQRANSLNQNGRIYPRPILERELRNYQKFINERRALGCLDHSDSTSVELSNVCHLITMARMDDSGVVYGDVEILPTPAGETLRNLVESNVTVGISSRGFGSTEMDENGHQVVQSDFQLICWDFVSEPSTPGAFMMKESREFTPEEVRKKLMEADLYRKSDRIYRALNNILGWELK